MPPAAATNSCRSYPRATPYPASPSLRFAVGWLKTVDSYAEGTNNSIQYANVDLTLDTVLQSLLENPDRRFVVVEQAFFQRWYQQSATDEQAAQMRQVIASGQLTFINGWVEIGGLTPGAGPLYRP